MSETYNVLLSGDISPYADQEAVIKAFAKMAHIDEQKAQSIFASAPIAIKKGVNQETAIKFLKALEKIGAVARLDPPLPGTGEIAVDTLPTIQTTGSEAPLASGSAADSDPGPETVSEPAPVSNPAQDNNLSKYASPAETGIASSAGTGAESPTESATVQSAPVTANENTNASPSSTDIIQRNGPGLDFQIEGRPDYAFLTVRIPAFETLKVEASSMATMDTHIKMKTKLRGGFGRFLSGESIFINEFTAEGGPAEIGIAPGSPGDMTHLYLADQTVYLQNSAFVASTMGVAIESKWQGLTKGFFSGESLFLIRAQGTGDLWFNTYGALIEIDVEEDYVVDTGNIVAFTDGLEYDISKVGGYKSLFFSGEGFVCRFRGKGKVWIQTRGVAAFAWWAHLYRPVQNKG